MAQRAPGAVETRDARAGVGAYSDRPCVERTPTPPPPERAGRAPGLVEGRRVLASWGRVATPAGDFRLVPVRPVRDLPRIVEWMDDPEVARFWGLSGDPGAVAAHIRTQLPGDGHSVPCLGTLEGTPMSYWEIYRADLDPLARYAPVRAHDIGIHLLIGAAADRGRGLGTVLIAAVASLVFARRPLCSRVLAEPDLRNTRSVGAFLGAGFRRAEEVELPGKRAVLMVRERHASHEGRDAQGTASVVSKPRGADRKTRATRTRREAGAGRAGGATPPHQRQTEARDRTRAEALTLW